MFCLHNEFGTLCQHITFLLLVDEDISDEYEDILDEYPVDSIDTDSSSPDRGTYACIVLTS